jgi:hypothetical protein
MLEGTGHIEGQQAYDSNVEEGGVIDQDSSLSDDHS